MLAELEQWWYTLRQSAADALTLTASYVVTLPHLTRERMKLPLSQRELAKLSGVAASTIARVEAGAEVHPSTVRKLAEALHCTTGELMGTTE